MPIVKLIVVTATALLRVTAALSTTHLRLITTAFAFEGLELRLSLQNQLPSLTLKLAWRKLLITLK